MAGGMALETVAVAFAGTYCLALFSMMVFLPHVRRVQKLIASQWILSPLALLYGVLLYRSWSPDLISILLPGSLADGLSGSLSPQFIPTFEGIQGLFSRTATASSLLVHVLTINLFLGRVIFLDGLRSKIPTGLSLLLAAACGPLGVLCHYFLQALYHLFPHLRAAPDDVPLVLRSGDGMITVLPYT